MKKRFGTQMALLIALQAVRNHHDRRYRRTRLAAFFLVNQPLRALLRLT
jgi:hypothetical protein